MREKAKKTKTLKAIRYSDEPKEKEMNREVVIRYLYANIASWKRMDF